MTASNTDFRTLGMAESIPNDFVVPFYLEDLKRRISIAHIDQRFYAFDDLCTCGPEACPLSGGLLTGKTIMCQCHGSRFDIQRQPWSMGQRLPRSRGTPRRRKKGPFESKHDPSPESRRNILIWDVSFFTRYFRRMAGWTDGIASRRCTRPSSRAGSYLE